MGHHGNAFTSFGAVDFDDTGLLAYYKFDEASGNIINQSESGVDLGSAADMIITGATFGQTGILDDALSFDGVNDFGELGTSLSQWDLFHKADQDWSVNFWVNFTTLVAEKAFFGNLTTETRGIRVILGGTPSTQFLVKLFSTTGTMVNTTVTHGQTLTTGTWTMITLVNDYSLGSNQYTFYINGSSAVSFSRSVAGSTGNTDVSLKTMSLGSAASGFNNALQDELSIWNRLLSASEISDLYNGGAALAIY